jgi:pimeloyl-ACP methyl ester carboxylesterase
MARADGDAPGVPARAPLARWLGELRAPLERLAFGAATWRLDALPRGDGHPVLLLPAFGMDERAMAPLGHALARLGYAMQDWGEGRNAGLRAQVFERLQGRLDDLVRRHGQPASLVGWSAGGLYARELARARPAAVRRVITLGCPLPGAGPPALADAFRALLDTWRAQRGDSPLALHREPPPVPTTAIHSRSDAVVDWRCTLESEGPAVENVAVDGSHLGLPVNAAVLRVLAERLARPAS